MTVLTAEKRMRDDSSGLTLPAATVALCLAAAVALFVPGVASFGPVFGGFEGYLAAGGGVALGLTIGVLARRYRWSLPGVVAAILAAYLVFGGPFALRATTLFGVIPTPDTLLRLLPLTVQAWRDLLTVSPPVSAFVGPAIVPFVSGLVLATVAGWFALSPRRYLWTIAPPLVLLVIGILWGLDVSPAAPFLGVGFGVVALAFAVWRRLRERSLDQSELIAGAASGLDTRRLLLAGVSVLAAGGVALAASPLLGGVYDRQVLRQVVQPPLNLRDYASPLTSFRYLEVDLKNVALFSVNGLPAGQRIRLATLDAYDGRVYNVADASAGFLRVGDRIGVTAPGNATTLDIAVKDYAGVWLPGGGDVRSVRFSGANAPRQAEGLYYNFFGGTLLTTAGVASGDAYRVQVLPRPAVTDAEAQRVSSSSTPATDRVPDVVGKLATEFAGEAPTAIEQLRNIEKHLQQGFYDNGASGNSRAGHSTERIATMLTGQQLVGDDEQYAVAMALMARQLGFPARVVMGFYPDAKTAAGGTLEVTGAQAHVWVEVPFDNVGWVSFDPTPPRDRTPQTLQPSPRPNPKPQVLPPPEPPPNKAQDPQDDPGKKREQEDKPGDDLLLRIAIGVGIGLGAGALISSPFLAIRALKRRRRSRRMNAPAVADRFAGGWSEVVDAATDLGTPVPALSTRREAAAVLGPAFPKADAWRIAEGADAGVFGVAAPSEASAAELWTDVDKTLAAMRAQVGRWRRFLGFCSIRSFGRPRLALPKVNVKGIDLAGAVKRRPRKASV